MLKNSIFFSLILFLACMTLSAINVYSANSWALKACYGETSLKKPLSGSSVYDGAYIRTYIDEGSKILAMKYGDVSSESFTYIPITKKNINWPSILGGLMGFTGNLNREEINALFLLLSLPKMQQFGDEVKGGIPDGKTYNPEGWLFTRGFMLDREDAKFGGVNEFSILDLIFGGLEYYGKFNHKVSNPDWDAFVLLVFEGNSYKLKKFITNYAKTHQADRAFLIDKFNLKYLCP